MKRFVLLILISIAIYFKGFSQDYSDYTRCAEQDSLALVAFYNATGGPNWTSNSVANFSTAFLSDDVLTYYTTDYPNAGMGKWLEGPVKNWFGVLLAKRQIGNTTDSAWRVIHLQPILSRRSAGENNLVGYVPKEVGLLTALERFKINGNKGLKNTEVPDEIYHPTIEIFDFEGVFFSGILSSAIRKCTNLVYPNFRDNNFDSIPTFDFVTKPWGYWGLFWIYRNRVSWATLEPTVAFFVENGYTYEARDQNNVGRAKEIVVTPGSPFTLTCNEAGSQGTCTWYKRGANTYKTGTSITINSAAASDTGNYTVLIANDYIKLNDANQDYVNTFTKPIHVTFVASTPVKNLAYTSYDGNDVSIRFSKPMVIPSSVQTSEFVVKKDGVSVPVTSITRTGRLNDILVLKLGQSLGKGNTITVSYTKGTIVDVNGGALNSFTDAAVTNYTRVTPNLVKAITRTDGAGIVLTFDQYIDPETFNPSDFIVSGTNTVAVSAISLMAGELDAQISKQIALVLENDLSDTDSITISYTKGSMNALYGGALQSFNDFAVENIVVAVRYPVTLQVVDGTGTLNMIAVKGDMGSKAFALYDDGTNGDATAGDHIWTKNMQLTEGTYGWEVFNRTISITYDTVIVQISPDQVSMTITKIENNNDSLISGETNLSFTLTKETTSGNTIYNYRTNSVLFILDMQGFIAENPVETIEPYLMGIKNDWTSGIAMTKFDNSENYYTAKTSGYTIGEIINYNFRNGDTWENGISGYRSHTIVGTDTIRTTFGYSGIMDVSKGNYCWVYPNPVGEGLNLNLPNGEILQKIRIINVYGQQIVQSVNPTLPVNVNSMESGFYILIASDKNGNTYKAQFIKQ
jgi:uncharacterized repeat protein (TIGR02059 family)